LEQIKDDVETIAVEIGMALDDEDDIGPRNDGVVLEQDAWLTARGELAFERQFGDDKAIRLVAYSR
jgi:hypothetical protein